MLNTSKLSKQGLYFKKKFMPASEGFQGYKENKKVYFMLTFNN